MRRPAWFRKACLKTGVFIKRRLDRLYYHHAGGPARPVFFDVERTFPALRVIDQNYDVIREELLAILPRKDSIPRYHEVDFSQTSISTKSPGAWRTFFVSVHGAGNRLPNRHLCPRTVEIVERVPDLLQAFFSILDPRKSVPAHDGPHFSYLRYHTGFVVPHENPPKIRVKDQFYTWKERESVLFDDSWNHEVYNESDGVRVVLITDVARPGPLYLRLLQRLALRLTLLGIEDDAWETLFERVKTR